MVKIKKRGKFKGCFGRQRLIGDRYNAHSGAAAHGQLLRSSAGKIDDPSAPMGSAVIDRHLDRLAVAEIRDLSPAPQWQARVGGSQRVLVKALTTRGSFAMKSWSIPGRLADLLTARHFGGMG